MLFYLTMQNKYYSYFEIDQNKISIEIKFALIARVCIGNISKTKQIYMKQNWNKA